MKHFKFYNKHDVLNLTRMRRFETKLGESVHVLADGRPRNPEFFGSAYKAAGLGSREDHL